MKVCTKCNQTKELTEFQKDRTHRDGHRTRCKVCYNAHYKKYRKNNREKERIRVKKWRETNREKVKASNRKRNQRPEVKKQRNARIRERRKTDPQFRLARNLRRRLHSALKGKNKSASTMALLGCTVSHLKDHLEKQFLPRMTWENYGTWHADHMMPCASFDLEDPEQQRQCFHYTNLQPMWATENMSKNDKVIYNRVWNGNQWINN